MNGFVLKTASVRVVAGEALCRIDVVSGDLFLFNYFETTVKGGVSQT